MVASKTRGPGFKFSHRQLLLNICLLLTVCRKEENKEKEAGNGPFFKKELGHRGVNSNCTKVQKVCKVGHDSIKIFSVNSLLLSIQIY